MPGEDFQGGVGGGVDGGANGWGEWRRHVLMEVEEHRKDLRTINDKLGRLDPDEIKRLISSLDAKMAAYHELATTRMTTFEVGFEALKTEMKIKSGLWGAVGSLFAIIVLLGIEFLRGAFK
jgi:hypothetical protein